ncbi:recombinase family protein [Mesorhizobium qingshengii]|uniref:Resolvase, N terminal domain n=1 Tax=Mesorhizobium qingshengii TaxID=1165689 RepID=A0A1G5ZSU9_9HYPH|nr:Resolvase, N terminal domain [Mesorhizobium qingshengii]
MAKNSDFPRAAASRPRFRAAQYLRMSKEHQTYSIDNQKDAIRNYADIMGYEIIATYEDAGRSGLKLDGRLGRFLRGRSPGRPKRHSQRGAGRRLTLVGVAPMPLVLASRDIGGRTVGPAGAAGAFIGVVGRRRRPTGAHRWGNALRLQ